MCHFDVVLSKDSLQGFGEGGVEGEGDGEGVVRRLSAGSLSSGGVAESALYFLHDGGDPLGREAVEETDVSDGLELRGQVLRRTDVVGTSC